MNLWLFCISLIYQYALCTKKHCSTRSRSAIQLLRKELLDKHLHHIKESPSTGSSSDAVADTMLLSFVNNPQPSFRSQTVQASETRATEKSSELDSSERYVILFFPF